MREPQYQNYIRNNWPLPFVEPWLWGPTNVAKPPFRWKFILTTHCGDKSGWHYHAKELLKLGYRIDRYLARPKVLEAFTQRALRVKGENLFFAGKIARLQLAKFSSEQLVALLRQWHLLHSRFAAAYMAIDATDETLEIDIKNALKKSARRYTIDDIAALLTPDVPTYVQKEHKGFCTLAKLFHKNVRSVSAKKAIARHARKWWWTVMGWGQYKPLDATAILKKLQKVKNIDTVLTVQKHDAKTYAVSMKQKKKLWRTLPIKARRLLDAFEILAEMHDMRKEMQMKMMWTCFSLTEALLKKFRIPVSFRDYILIEEYCALAENTKPALKELQARKKAYWCQATSDGKILVLSGKKAIARLRRSKIYETQSRKKTDTIRGVSASPGVARGRVRVGLNPNVLLRLFQPGEILVTSQTTPDFAPIMKRAAAIVTNEGGITSHTAIVSRELKKPCVIGTKIATDVLRNGDMVEVDADRGVITVLNRK